MNTQRETGPAVRLVPMTAEMYRRFFREFENDRDLCREGQAYEPYLYSEDRVARYIRRQSDLHRVPLAIMLDDEIAGEILVKNIEPHRSAELSITLKNPNFKDRGIGTQALKEAVRYVMDEMDIPAVFADALKTNGRSRHVLEKTGFIMMKEDGDFVYYRIGRDPRPDGYGFISLRERPELKEAAARWFHEKWGVPEEAYLACMDEYLSGATEYGWYLCLDGERIAGGLGVIENDFHDRKDLFPNVCAVYTEEADRCRGIAGALLNMAVEDLRSKGISPVYLVTDHTGFYERYGWEFLCMVQGDGEDDLTRMYIHR